MHTTYNVFRRTKLPASAVGLDSEEDEVDAVVFYSNAAPTVDAEGGVVAVQPGAKVGEPPSLYWFHGPRKVGVAGGSGWKQPRLGNAFPVAGPAMSCNVHFMDQMVKAGYKNTWGYAKLVPVAMVPL